jgi:hypothetical protein
MPGVDAPIRELAHRPQDRRAIGPVTNRYTAVTTGNQMARSALYPQVDYSIAGTCSTAARRWASAGAAVRKAATIYQAAIDNLTQRAGIAA